MTVLISPSGSDSESASSEVMAGDGVVGASTGTIDMRSITTAGTTPAATRFTTAAISTGAAEFAAERTEHVAERTAHAAERIGLSTATTGPLEATPHPAAKAAPALEPSAATTMAVRNAVFPRADKPASVAEDFAVAVVAVAAGIVNRSFGRLIGT